MFEFKGTAADSPQSSRPDWRVVDHQHIQDLGRRPFTTMFQPGHHQRAKTERARRPSLQLPSRSHSFAPNYSRPQDRDDLSDETPRLRRPPRNPADRRPISSGSQHTRGDSLDSFTPKAWLAKGSRFLKRSNSKHELTSLRTLDWVEESQEARHHHLLDHPPPEFRRSRTQSTNDVSTAPRLNISEPFNFHHITHTRPHHVQKLERADPNELVSEFFALRASQASRPELRGIKAQDIQREDFPRDALLPDSPSRPGNDVARIPSFRTSRTHNLTQSNTYDATFPIRSLEHTRPLNNFSHPSAAYHSEPSSPASPDFFTYHHESPSDTDFGASNQIESMEPLDYPIGTWNDGIYDLASPHAVTTNDYAEWNRQVPFSMVKTELAPVEEDDETEEKRNSILAYCQSPIPANLGAGKAKSFPGTKVSLRWGSDACLPNTEDSQGKRDQVLTNRETPSRLPTTLRPVDGGVFGALRRHCESPEPLGQDQLDDVPARPRLSRHMSLEFNDMDGFWDMASDAINCSYALGAEGDSNFDWHRSSIHVDEMYFPTADDMRTDAFDTAPESSNQTVFHASPSPGKDTLKRSSSLYSSSSSSLLPVQTFPSKLEPSSAGSTESSFSSIPEAVTPNETTESAMATRFSSVKYKEWYQPAYMDSGDHESQTYQDDMYHHMYTSDYPQDASFQLHNVGRIDGSTINNSPRSSQSPISKSSSQESFWYTQAASNARRPRNVGSISSLPELMPSKNSREKIDPAVDQMTDSLALLNPSDFSSDNQQTSTAQRRRSPNLAKGAAQNIILSKVKSAEEPVPPLPTSRNTSSSDISSLVQDSSMPPPLQATAGRRMRSGSSASSLNARSSRGSYSVFPPAHSNPLRTP